MIVSSIGSHKNRKGNEMRSVYTVCYKIRGSREIEKKIDVIAGNKSEAFDVAFYEAIPEKEGEMPFSAWVKCVTYQNGNTKHFNTSEGNPY